MSTASTTVTQLNATATALASGANALAATATAIATLITALQGQQLLTQPQLDAVNESLASSLASIQASQNQLAALVPTTPAAPAPAPSGD